jgi:CHAP domain
VPIINGKFYINPAHGRGLERALISETNSNDVSGRPEQEKGDHWVTINGRHVQLDEGQAGRALPTTREKIAATAKNYGGRTDWGFDKQKDNFAPGTNKCNKFVYDVTREAGATAIVIGRDGKPRPPLAGEWADRKTPIPGWRVLGPNESPQPGDVAAYKLPGQRTFTGHSRIVTSVDTSGAVRGVAAHDDVIGPDEKFNRARESGVAYRRYIGGR